MHRRMWKWAGVVGLVLATAVATWGCDKKEARVVTVRESTNEAPDMDPQTKSEAEYEMVAPGEMVVDD
jgi:hypothetical protein